MENNTFIIMDNPEKIEELTQISQIKRGMFLYVRTGNMVVIKKFVELPTAREMLLDTYKKNEAEVHMRILMEEFDKLKSQVPEHIKDNVSVGIGEFANHPSGDTNLNKDEAINFVQKKETFENYVYLVISRNGLKPYFPHDPDEKKDKIVLLSKGIIKPETIN